MLLVDLSHLFSWIPAGVVGPFAANEEIGMLHTLLLFILVEMCLRLKKAAEDWLKTLPVQPAPAPKVDAPATAQ